MRVAIPRSSGSDYSPCETSFLKTRLYRQAYKVTSTANMAAAIGIIRGFFGKLATERGSQKQRSRKRSNTKTTATALRIDILVASVALMLKVADASQKKNSEIAGTCKYMTTHCQSFQS